MTPTERLAEFAVSLSLSSVPRGVSDRLGLVLADTLAAAVGGADDDAVRALAAAWTDDGGVPVPGTMGLARVDRAAYLVGTAGTTLELDEGHRFAAGHPAIHVLPAVLADAASRDAEKETFLAALAAGYEVAARAGMAMQPLADGYHPHGVWGAVGAAAGVARLRGLDAATTADALAVAANSAQHTRFAAATEGATVRNTYAGASNQDGLTAVDAAEAGFTGLADGVVRHLAPATADGVDTDALTGGLGETWEVEHGYFKRFAACRYTHPAVEAALALRDGVDPDDVERVEVGTYPAAASLDEKRPESALAAKFSVPYAVAAAFALGHADKAAFDLDSVPEPVFALAARTTVSVDDAVAARAPDARGARVTVRLADGTAKTSEVERAKGDPERPFTSSEIREKFDGLVAPALGDDGSERLWNAAVGDTDPRELLRLTRR